jgi:hypothetical protein
VVRIIAVVRRSYFTGARDLAYVFGEAVHALR